MTEDKEGRAFAVHRYTDKLLPNFFIIGGPKCGTTALSEYLRSHPNVCFSAPKEPMYFLSEWASLQIAKTENDYLRCFNHCRKNDPVAVGEGSALYLLSKHAVESILEFNPDAKFIIMLRNPADMARSLHAQNLFYGDEDVESFEKAWELQGPRSSGRAIPRQCRHPILLQYKKICSLGALTERAFFRIPVEKRHVVVFDDFITNTRAVYAAILQFLGLPDDGRRSFPRVNERKRAKSQWVNHVLACPPYPLQVASRLIKRLVGVESLGVHQLVVRLNATRADQEPLSAVMRKKLDEEFRDDINLLSKIVGRDLSMWKTLK